jgi:serine/threonine protein kinase
MIGSTLDDRYLILRQIGQGGMGAVYEARHVGTNRRVAIKVILKEAMQSEQIARFQREARIVGAVESQHITQVFDTGVDRATGCPYIAMEYLDGDDVHGILRRNGPVPIDLVLRIGYQACMGLGRAHDAGVVHRDIKSGNLFLHKNEPGHRLVKLLDFGVAKVGQELGDGGLTKTGALIGSPLYMSPEQARGRPVDPRSDVFSLGVTLYEMLGGRRPNEEVTQLGELIVKIVSEPSRWLQDVAPWVPAEVAGVVHRALAIEPSARYQSAAEFAATLRAMLPAGHHIEESMLVPLDPALRARAAPRGSPHELSGNVRAMSVSGLSTSGNIASPPAARRSSAGLVVGGAAAMLAIGAAAAVFVFVRGHGAPDPGLAAPTATSAEIAPGAAASQSPTVALPASSGATGEAPTAAAEPSSSAAAGPTATAAAATSPSAKPSATAAPKATTSKTSKPVTKPKDGDETSRK